MNIVDIVIIFLIFGYLSKLSVKSSLYHIAIAFTVGLGFVGSIYVSTILSPLVASDMAKGLLTIAFILIACSSILLFTRRYFMKRHIRSQIHGLLSKNMLKRIDRLGVIPSKIVICLVAVWLASQTFVYIPIVAWQFMAQGSSTMILGHKLPSTWLESQAQKLSSDQPQHIYSGFSHEPIRFADIADSDYEDFINEYGDSIVRITGKLCLNQSVGGTGFVVEGGYVVTAAHVIAGAASIYAQTTEGMYPLTPLVIDESKDIAITYSRMLRGKELPVREDPLEAPVSTVTFGYAGGRDLTYRSGNTVPKVEQEGLKHVAIDTSEDSAYTTQYSLAQGMSGGPTFDANYEVIGLTSGGLSDMGIIINNTVINDMINKAKLRIFSSRTGICTPYSGGYY